VGINFLKPCGDAKLVPRYRNNIPIKNEAVEKTKVFSQPRLMYYQLDSNSIKNEYTKK